MIKQLLIWMWSFLFISSSYDKIFKPELFFKNLKRYDFLPEFSITYIVYYIAFLELLISGAVLMRSTRKAGLITAQTIVVFFTLALFFSYVKYGNIDCGCGGVFGGTTIVAICRNLVLFCLAFYLYKNVEKRS